MGLSHSPSIITDGLDFYVDPNNTRCYPGFGNTVYNIVNSSIGATLVGFTSALLDNTEARSFFFDGTNDSLPFSNSSSYSPTKITVCIWFKKAHGSSFKALIDKGRDLYGGWTLCADETANKVTFKARIFYTSAVSGAIVTSSNYNSNAWNFVCGVYDGAYLSIYLNGVLSNSAYYLHEVGSNSYPITVGAANDGYNVNANIGQAFIYGRGLSAAEINQNYHATKKKYLIEENIVTNGLILNLDPGNPNSYSGAGNTIYDLAGFGNTGTLVSATFSSLNSGSLSGVISKNFSVNSGQNFTVSAWVYPTGFGQRMAIVGNAYPYSTNSGWYFFIANNYFGLNQSVFFSAGTDQVSVGTISYLVSINKWHYVSASVTNGGSSVKIYVDGIEATYGRNGLSNVSLDYSTNEFYVGKRHSATGDGFGGNISQVKVYNRALSATEIQQNYNATKGRFLNALPPVRNGLVLELDAANTSSYSGFGNTWYDLTGNGYNYTLTNGPVFSSFGTTQNFFFDGSNDRALAINPISLGTNHTVSIIVKPSSASEDGILFGDYGHDNTGYAMYVNNGASIFYSATNYTNISITLSANWSMLTVTRIGTSISFYQNGSLIGSNTLGGNNPLTLSSIADYNGGGFPFAGNISQVSCYNRALSAYEIKQNFDYYRTRYGI